MKKRTVANSIARARVEGRKDVIKFIGETYLWARENDTFLDPAMSGWDWMHLVCKKFKIKAPVCGAITKNEFDLARKRIAVRPGYAKKIMPE